MNKTNKVIAEQVFQEHFGMGTKDLYEKSVEQVVKVKAEEYKAQDELGRAMTHISTVTEFEVFKRSALSFFTGEFTAIIKTLAMVDNIPTAYKRETMRFFNSDFPEFNSGAAKSLGTFLKNGLESVKKDPAAREEKGKYAHLREYIMQGIVERSRSPFFMNLRKDVMALSKFERKLSIYCGIVWDMYMVEEATYTNDMPLSERVRNRNEYAKAQVEDFLGENYRVKKDERIKSDDLYEAYEIWVEVNDGELLGRGTFISAITRLLPTVSQLTIGKSAYIKGLRKVEAA